MATNSWLFKQKVRSKPKYTHIHDIFRVIYVYYDEKILHYHLYFHLVPHHLWIGANSNV